MRRITARNRTCVLLPPVTLCPPGHSCPVSVPLYLHWPWFACAGDVIHQPIWGQTMTLPVIFLLTGPDEPVRVATQHTQGSMLDQHDAWNWTSLANYRGCKQGDERVKKSEYWLPGKSKASWTLSFIMHVAEPAQRGFACLGLLEFHKQDFFCQSRHLAEARDRYLMMQVQYMHY